MPRNGINVKFSLKANCYIIGVCAGIQECPRLLKNSRLSGNGCSTKGYSPRSEPEATSSLRRSPEERWVKPYLSKDWCLTSVSFVLCSHLATILSHWVPLPQPGPPSTQTMGRPEAVRAEQSTGWRDQILKSVILWSGLSRQNSSPLWNLRIVLFIVNSL